MQSRFKHCSSRRRANHRVHFHNVCANARPLVQVLQALRAQRQPGKWRAQVVLHRCHNLVTLRQLLAHLALHLAEHSGGRGAGKTEKTSTTYDALATNQEGTVSELERFVDVAKLAKQLYTQMSASFLGTSGGTLSVTA
jgi:hypothetical protein